MRRSWLVGVINALVMILFIIGGYFVLRAVDKIRAETYAGPILYFVLMFFYYTGIGAILGSGSLVEEIRKAGSWSVDLVKLIILGTPALFFSCSYLLLFSHFQFLKLLAQPLFPFIYNDVFYVAVFQIILGYVLTTAFYKVDKQDGKGMPI